MGADRPNAPVAGHPGRVRALTARAVLIALGLVVLGASPAAADPVAPGDYRSEVTGIEPPTEAVSARVLGGDSFLELDVTPGHTVIVLGYAEEPYLRFNPDGTVERNVRSPATYLNDDRLAAVEPPPEARPDAEPVWEQVATGGTYAWHDHRTHWMGSTPPPVARGEVVGGAFDPWRVPLVVDGSPTDVTGTLRYEAAPSPIPWAVLALAAAGALVALGRRAPLLAASGALTLASALAVVLGRAEHGMNPPDAGANPLLWVLPAVALLTGAAATLLGDRRPAVVLALASVASLAGWGLLRISVLLKPVLPSPLPDPLDRAGVALALGAAVGAAWLAVTSGALALPDLEDDPDDSVPADGPTDR
jgi:hypothetical protein